MLSQIPLSLSGDCVFHISVLNGNTPATFIIFELHLKKKALYRNSKKRAGLYSTEGNTNVEHDFHLKTFVYGVITMHFLGKQ